VVEISLLAGVDRASFDLSGRFWRIGRGLVALTGGYAPHRRTTFHSI
jgi:hypothetical protein